MKNRQITIKDIAHELSISPSTVSRALKNSPDISEQTKKAVRECAKRFNYKPNALALSIRTGRSNIIGVIVPKLVHYFFSSVISGIEKVAEEEDFSLVICQSMEDYEREVKSIQTFQSIRVSGIIVSLAKSTQNYDHFFELEKNNINMVFFDRICTGLNTDRVVVDDYAGSYTAVEYLIQTGCKRIAFFCAPLHLEISKNRRNGYMDALRANGISVDEGLIHFCDNYNDAVQLTPKLLEKENRPDAFFAINDETASGILYATKLAGYHVPEEISVCGFCDGYIAQNSDPKLTTVEQHGYEVGESAARLLIDRINGKNSECKFNNRIIKTNLIVRGTTK